MHKVTFVFIQEGNYGRLMQRQDRGTQGLVSQGVTLNDELGILRWIETHVEVVFPGRGGVNLKFYSMPAESTFVT